MTLTGLRTAPPRLVATDLDGTFLDDAERVPLRLRRAVTRLDAAGVQLVLATGRPARWVLPSLSAPCASAETGRCCSTRPPAVL